MAEIITNEYAAELVEKLRTAVESRDETIAERAADPRDLLLIKLYDDLQALTKAMSFMGGGIKPVQRVG